MNSLKILSAVICALLGLWFQSPIQAQLIAGDSFDAPAATPTSKVSSGVGWDGYWTGNNTIASPGLNINSPGFASRGNKVHTQGNNTASFRKLKTKRGTGNQQTWVAFLMNLEVGTVGSGYGGVSLFDGEEEQFFVGLTNLVSTYGFAPYVDPMIEDRHTAVEVTSTPHLIVVLFAGGHDDTNVYMWVDPKPNTPPSLDAADASLADFKHNFSFDRVRIASGGNLQINVGELRIGATYESIFSLPNASQRPATTPVQPDSHTASPPNTAHQAQTQVPPVSSRAIKRVYLKAVSCFCGHSGQHGNVFVEYSDGKTQQLTTNDCAFKPQLAPDRQTIGWAEGSHFYVESYKEYWLSQQTFVCWRNGTRIRTLHHEHAYVDKWGFNSKGQIVSSSVGKHGATAYWLFDVATGKEIASGASRDKAPEWADFPSNSTWANQQPDELSYNAVNRSIQPGANAKSLIALLKSFPQKATFAQIRRLLPANTRFSKPLFIFTEGISGSRIQFTGSIHGQMFLQNKLQQEMQRKGSAPQEAYSNNGYYEDADTLTDFYVVMDKGLPRPKSLSKARVEALTKYIGRPTHKTYTDPNIAEALFDGGWSAEWKLDNQRTINYEDRRVATGVSWPLVELSIKSDK